MTPQKIHTQTVHEVLAMSYVSFLILCSIGIFLDTLFPLSFYLPYRDLYAFMCLVIGPAIIIWAQYASHRFHKRLESGASLQIADFMLGPYRFVRNPTHIGIIILVAGYSLVASSVILFGATLIAVLISNQYFRRHEKILDQTYGDPYRRYRTRVPLIM